MGYEELHALKRELAADKRGETNLKIDLVIFCSALIRSAFIRENPRPIAETQ